MLNIGPIFDLKTKTLLSRIPVSNYDKRDVIVAILINTIRAENINT